MLIAHYQGLWEKSGVRSYIRRVIDSQKARGHRVLYIDRMESAGLREHFPAEEPVRLVQDDHDLYQTAVREGVDVLHAHHTLEMVPPGALPVVRTVHNHRPYCPARFRYLRRRDAPCPRKYSLTGCLWGMLVDGCNGGIAPGRWASDFELTRRERTVLPHLRIIAVSAFVRDELVRSGYPDDDITVLHLPAPVPSESGSDGPTEPWLLFAGRLERPKGLRWLLESFARVLAPAVLHLAGAGPEEGDLRRRAERLGIADRVVFHGWLPEDQLAGAMRRARALVFPSVCHEAGGLAAFEAMARGKPVIMSRVGGMREIVQDGINGLIVEPGDRSGLADAMNLLIQDAGRAAEMGRAAMRFVEHEFTLEHHVDRLMVVYDEAQRKAGRLPSANVHHHP